MINKPINPFPFNTCVDMSGNWSINCEIPNDTIDQAYVSVNKLDTGEQIYGEYKTFDTPSNTINLEMSDSLAEYNDGEYSWNTFYYQVPDKDDNAIEYEVANADDNKIVLSANNAVVLSEVYTDAMRTNTFSKTTANESYNITSTQYDDDYIKYEGFPVLVLAPNYTDQVFNSVIGKVGDVRQENYFLRFINSATGSIIASAKLLLYSREALTVDDTFRRSILSDTFYRRYMTNSGDRPLRESIFYDDGDSDFSERNLTIQLCQIDGYDTNIQVGGYVFNNDRLCRITSVENDNCIRITTMPSLNSVYGYRGVINREANVDSLDDLKTHGIYLLSSYDYDVKTNNDNYYIVTTKDNVLFQYKISKTSYKTSNERIWHSRYFDVATSTWSGWSEFETDLTMEKLFTSNPHVGSKIQFYPANALSINVSPYYYFRAKTNPVVGIHTYNKFTEEVESINETSKIKSYKLSDFRASFGIKYSSNVKFNYGYFYLSVLNPNTYNWDVVERSPMMLSCDAQNPNSVYTYDGFANGQKYKIYGVYTDIDGDEWTTDELVFSVDIPIITTHTDKFAVNFDHNKTTIDISLNKLLDIYKNMSVTFYKAKKSDIDYVPFLRYAGGGLCKTGGENGHGNSIIVENGDIIAFDKWYDFNIQNDAYYDYYARVEYYGLNYTLDGEDVSTNEEYNTMDGSWNIDIFYVASNIHTEFEGTSILSLEKISETQLGVVQNFNIFYHFDENKPELTNEIIREYINTFSKYPKELKGYQNNISSRCSGLLGDDIDGLYVEPKGIRDKWINFVNDDTVKFYRGYDGQTMVISINSSTIKPRNYSNYGIVNEVNISFKEIASTDQYAVFGTERTGD